MILTEEELKTYAIYVPPKVINSHRALASRNLKLVLENDELMAENERLKQENEQVTKYSKILESIVGVKYPELMEEATHE